MSSGYFPSGSIHPSQSHCGVKHQPHLQKKETTSILNELLYELLRYINFLNTQKLVSGNE